ncbi:taste receptor type 2 member 102-like [Cricetulus griseus]|uniref:Taste receptor type 2 n=1 Tax=Cricetulus griseus TaxID=10029 RepID=A0A9J7GFV9_CRIGR|nr:taste receptor type 2 member 102-like [Cricetulus griseus]XP_027285570.1 taste receptor type 2 member 102-like [Cricetulus griseus]
MDPVLHSFATIVIVAEFIFGNLSNGFIVLSSFLGCITKQKLSSMDKILLTLAISRITLIWEIYIWFNTLCDPSLSVIGIEIQILYFSWMLSSHFSLWLATALSIFYLFRIANFSRQIFLYLKWRLKKLIVGVLLGSFPFLLANLMQTSITLEERIHQYGGNTTVSLKGMRFAVFSELTLFNMTLFSVTPFSLALMSFLLLLFSLWTHLQKMQLNFRGHRDPSSKAHTNAMKIMVSFLLLYATYFLSLLIAWIAEKHHNEPVHIICMITGLMYPSAHSLILILGNSKLKQTSLLMLKTLGCRLKGQTIPTTGGSQATYCHVF